MSKGLEVERRGPFWDVLNGRREPPAAVPVAGRAGRADWHGRVVRRGRDVAFLAGELLGPAGEVVATATASAIVRGRG